jgi:hypothetical protein
VAGKVETGRRRIDEAAKLCFLEGLRAGVSVKEAAARAGFSAEAFYCARKRDPILRMAWIALVELSAAEEREGRRSSSLVALVDGVEIAPNNRRALQKRWVRATRFTAERQQVFLDVFAATADFKAAAEAAGVCESTVYKALSRDPEFARRRDEARALAVNRLEDEAVRRQIAAQEKLRDPATPASELAIENERLMKLLAHYQRKGAGGAAEPGQSAMKRWSFDEAIAELDRIMRGYGLRRGIIPPEAPAGDAAPEGKAG